MLRSGPRFIVELVHLMQARYTVLHKHDSAGHYIHGL